MCVDVNVQAAEETAQLIKDDNGEAHFFKVDVTNEQHVKDSNAETLDKLGPVDILVNNAGISTNKNIEDITVDEAQQL